VNWNVAIDTINRHIGIGIISWMYIYIYIYIYIKGYADAVIIRTCTYGCSYYSHMHLQIIVFLSASAWANSGCGWLIPTRIYTHDLWISSGGGIGYFACKRFQPWFGYNKSFVKGDIVQIVNIVKVKEWNRIYMNN